MSNFVYVSKAEVKKEKKKLIELINEVQDQVRAAFTFRFDFVGSVERNMVTQDLDSNVGYDFDVNISVNDEDENYSAKQIKEIIIEGLKKIVKKYGYDYPENSTRVITIKVKNAKQAKILHSVDFCIVNDYRDDYGDWHQEYIRFNKSNNTYNWVQQSEDFYTLPDKIEWVKNNDLWDEVKELYLVNKDRNKNPDKKSRSIFAETVHQVCQKNGYYN